MNPPTIFEHQALYPGNHIRILLLYPSRDFHAPISCSLLQLSLDSLNSDIYPYEALSYTWGSKVLDHEVYCEGQKLLVTKNCHTALKYLRLRSGTRNLWIDSICIDQSSLPERNHQVKLMGDIYKRARKVVIWLGEGDLKTSQSIRRVRLMEGYFEGLERRFPNQHLTKPIRKVYQSKLRLSFSTTLLYSYILGATLNLENAGTYKRLRAEGLGAEWFTRAWTLQELLLAREPVLQCGFEIIPWDHLMDWCNAQVHWPTKGPMVMTFYTRIKYQEFQQKEKGQIQPKDSTTQHGELSSLNDEDLRMMCQMLLVNTWQRTSSDHRDIVYSQYAIMTDLGLHLPAPDYNKDLPTVYEEFAFAVIKKTNNLMLLTALPGLFNHSGWPSWVPHFAAIRGDINILVDDAIKEYPSFRSTFQLQHHPGRLRIEAVMFDGLKAVGPVLRKPKREEMDDLHGRRKGHLTAAYWLRDVYRMVEPVERCPNGDSPMFAFFETYKSPEKPLNGPLFSMTGFGGRRSTLDKVGEEEMIGGLGIFVAGLTEAIDRYLEESQDPDTLEEAFIKIVDGSAFDNRFFHQKLEFIGKIFYSSKRTKPFVLANGCVGIGNADYEVGDMVVFFYGSLLPAIVRPTGGHYRLVGPAVIKGIPDHLWPLSNNTELGDVQLIDLI